MTFGPKKDRMTNGTNFMAVPFFGAQNTAGDKIALCPDNGNKGLLSSGQKQILIIHPLPIFSFADAGRICLIRMIRGNIYNACSLRLQMTRT